jgi:hypothetical protein
VCVSKGEEGRGELASRVDGASKMRFFVAYLCAGSFFVRVATFAFGDLDEKVDENRVGWDEAAFLCSRFCFCDVRIAK